MLAVKRSCLFHKGSTPVSHTGSALYIHDFQQSSCPKESRFPAGVCTPKGLSMSFPRLSILPAVNDSCQGTQQQPLQLVGRRALCSYRKVAEHSLFVWLSPEGFNH